MALLDLFSRREKRFRRRPKDVPEVYRYDDVPESLRVQILHILDRVLGDAAQVRDKRAPDGPRQAYGVIVETLCKDFGVEALVGGRAASPRDHRAELWEFLLGEQDIDRVLDAVELSFRCVDYVSRRFEYLQRPKSEQLASEAISELNVRFREHRIGYLYRTGEIVKVI